MIFFSKFVKSSYSVNDNDILMKLKGEPVNVTIMGTQWDSLLLCY